MTPSFPLLATLTAGAATVLAIGWLLFGSVMLRRWRLTPGTTDVMLGRRIGTLYAGLALIFFLGRHAPPSELRNLLALGALVVVTGLGLLGSAAYLRRQVGPAMLASVVVEVLLALGYALHLSPLLLGETVP